MFFRTVRSAAVASWLLAANLVVLTLYLNPEVTLLGEATALFLSLFLPYALLGTAAFLVFTLFHAAFRFGPRPGSLLRGWPWLGSFLSLPVTAPPPAMEGRGPAFPGGGGARATLRVFARRRRRGASGPLAPLRPREAPPIWTTVVTGRLPRDHGVKSFVTYRLLGSSRTYELLPKGALVGLLERASLVSTRPVTSTSRRRRALWNVLSAFGVPAGVVRLWGTYPPEQGQGFTLSNYFHLFRDDKARAEGTLQPPDLLPE